jgi:lipopolysaccharide/colanic/teichoic acid biosynthesis glycosyltransferase
MWPSTSRGPGVGLTTEKSATAGTLEGGSVSATVGEYSLAEPRAHRIFDVSLALLALLVSWPLWILVALAILVEDGRPIFFAQRRWGKDKRRIVVYKFRSMIAGGGSHSEAVQASSNDPRITRVGRILRASSLDELPQIISILRGDMSWVGPRALPINEVQARERGRQVEDEAVRGFAERCSVKPGLTGIAQIYARRDVPRRQKFKYDLLYIRRRNLWLDVRLIVLSLWITARGAWGRVGRKV